jgi:hypothetical protein
MIRWRQQSLPNHGRSRRIAGWCSLLTTLVASLSFASTALAAPTLELTRGSAEPVESIATQLGAVITNGGGRYFWLHVKAAGSAGCGANAIADSGEIVFGGGGVSSSTNPVTESRNWTFQTAGNYKVCAWVTKDPSGTEVEAFAEAALVVRKPNLSLSIAVPAAVLPSQTFQVTTTATAETERKVGEYEMPNTGSGCPANADAASHAPGVSSVLYSWNVIGGPLTETRNQSLAGPGSYLYCAYFEYPRQESPPELSASAQMSVVPPPPPCVVPPIHRGASLASVGALIRAANCSVGAIHYPASSSVARGGVVGLTPASGTKLGNGAAVGILVSAGRFCIVPVVKPGTRIGRAKRLLAAANCGARIAYTHSRRVHKGRVVRLGSRAHSRLYPLSRVPIVVSTGR